MASKEAQKAWRDRKKSGVDLPLCVCGKKLWVDSRDDLCKACWFKSPEGRAYNQHQVSVYSNKIDLVAEAKAIAVQFGNELGFVNTAALAESADKNELEVIAGIGLCHYHHRRDRQTTIYSLAVAKDYQGQGWGRLLVCRVLCAAIENGCDRLLAKCPEGLSSNDFYSRLGFVLTTIQPGRKRRLNIWEYAIRLPLLFYCGGGGASKFDAIASAEGWRLGLKSVGKNRAVTHMEMIDNDWKDYDHSRHLAMVKANKPLITTARDIEDISQLPEVLKQARELAKYAGRVIIIPKVKCWIPSSYWLGYSVPTSYGGTTIEPAWFGDRPVHLLGGSPDFQAKYYRAIDNVVSLDGNYAMRLADYGKASYQGASAGVSTGKGCYDSMQISLAKQKEYWHSSREVCQLSLFS